MESSIIPVHFSEWDWLYTPNDDPEWTFMLNRQGFLMDLAKAYLLTGEERYFSKWKALILDWIKKEGIPSKENKDAWRTMIQELDVKIGYSHSCSLEKKSGKKDQ